MNAALSLPTPERPAAIEPVDDLSLMLALWRARSPQCRDAALEIASINLANSRKDAHDGKR